MTTKTLKRHSAMCYQTTRLKGRFQKIPLEHCYCDCSLIELDIPSHIFFCCLKYAAARERFLKKWLHIYSVITDPQSVKLLLSSFCKECVVDVPHFCFNAFLVSNL